MRILRLAAGFFLGLMTVSAPVVAQTEIPASELENTLFIELKTGRVVIKMRPDLAPQHVARIKELAREGFYDGIVFHRVIDGFMAQTGDPGGDGTGGSGKNLRVEFSAEPHRRGTVPPGGSSSHNRAQDNFLYLLYLAPQQNNHHTVRRQEGCRKE